ncbi:hypothetical protein [Streptomyces sp. NPDC058964]|uniref:hypothetical protein n=1 Tax=Streptomyces sp. NPDC058964 TaxID=3346681 RepID=UPI0036C2025F
MRSPIRSTTRSLGAAGVIAALAVAVAASPASAATYATKSSSTPYIPLPGKPDVKITAELRVQLTDTAPGGYRWYSADMIHLSWDGSSFFTGGKRFNDVYVHLQLKHGGKVKAVSDENITYDLNHSEQDSKYVNSNDAEIRTKSTYWQADAVIYADVADDGKGYLKYDLKATPTIK